MDQLSKYNGNLQNVSSFNEMGSMGQFPQQNNINSHQIINGNNGPSYEESMNYYQQEACRLYIANVVLTNQVKELLNEQNDLLAKISQLEKRQQDSFDYNDDKKQRHRRAATEIERHYKCSVETCQKSYGSEGSLAQHLKLKHPELYSQMCSSNMMSNSQVNESKDESANIEESGNSQSHAGNNNNNIINNNNNNNINNNSHLAQLHAQTDINSTNFQKLVQNQIQNGSSPTGPIVQKDEAKVEPSNDFDSNQ